MNTGGMKSRPSAWQLLASSLTCRHFGSVPSVLKSSISLHRQAISRLRIFRNISDIARYISSQRQETAGGDQTESSSNTNTNTHTHMHNQTLIEAHTSTHIHTHTHTHTLALVQQPLFLPSNYQCADILEMDDLLRESILPESSETGRNGSHLHSQVPAY